MPPELTSALISFGVVLIGFLATIIQLRKQRGELAIEREKADERTREQFDKVKLEAEKGKLDAEARERENREANNRLIRELLEKQLAENNQLSVRVDNVTAELVTVKAARDVATAASIDASNKAAGLAAQTESLTATTAKLQDFVNASTGKIGELEGKLTAQAANAQTERERLEKLIEELREGNRITSQAKAVAQKNLAVKQDELTVALAERDDYRAKVDKLTAELNATMQRVAELEREVKELRFKEKATP